MGSPKHSQRERGFKEPHACTHLRLLTASAARVCGLVGDGEEKGLPARGLREAGLEQVDFKEDWLPVCVLREPCRERGLRGTASFSCPWSLPLVLGSPLAARRGLTWKRDADTSKEPSPLACLLEAI